MGREVLTGRAAMAEGRTWHQGHRLPVGRPTHTGQVQRSRERRGQHDRGGLLPKWRKPIRRVRHVRQHLGVVPHGDQARPARTERRGLDQSTPAGNAIIIQRRRRVHVRRRHRLPVRSHSRVPRPLKRALYVDPAASARDESESVVCPNRRVILLKTAPPLLISIGRCFAVPPRTSDCDCPVHWAICR